MSDEKNVHVPSDATESTSVDATITTNDVDNNGVDKSNDETTNPEDFVHGLRLVVLLFCLCLCEFLVALDTTIIATAIPVISQEFNSLADIGWYGSAFFLTNCALQLLYGKFYTLLPVKAVLLTAMAIFEIGSLVCATAPSSAALIVGRAIAGIGAAGTFSGALITIIHSTEPSKRAGYSGMVVGMYGIASVAGPLLGGVFTSEVTWRWCFYINLPIGGAAMLGLVFFMRPPKKQRESLLHGKTPTWWRYIALFDPIGTIFFFGSIISLLLALQLGGTTYPFSSGRIVALFVVFGVCLIAFVVRQILGEQSFTTVPVRVFKKRVMVAAVFFAFCVGAHFIIMVYILPIWFQAVRGKSALQSGIDTLPILLAQTLFVVTGGIIVSVTGHFIPLVWLSVVVASVAVGLITTFTVDTSTGRWVGYQILYGVGCGVGYQQGITAAQAVLDKEDMEIGTATIVFVQNLAQSVFLSVANNVQVNELIKNLAKAVPQLNPEQIVAAGATGFQRLVPAAEYPAVLQAYNQTLVKVFQVALIMACLTALPAIGLGFTRAQVDKPKKTEDTTQEDGAVVDTTATAAGKS